ncbi:peroxisomal membrane protein PER10 [Podospora conica]|nr:peroxisomal membrane protein PER10 [Schizothecium conicum]
MTIREDLVAAAIKFLQDPNVAASPVEKRIAFLQAKNLTPEEVGAALARAGPDAAPSQQYAPSSSAVVQQQPPPYYGQSYPPQYPPYAWQPPPTEVPRRDWRDWFIMATVVSGVSYGLYSLGKRYVYPLVAPPTPDRLETDKKSIDDQFERTFALVEQLSKDTEALKEAEKERTERLDTALNTLETVMDDLKAANRRRDDEAQGLRDRVNSLKDSIPVALSNQKDSTDERLREVNAELKSLKTLITQRMNPPKAAATGVSNYLRPSASGTSTPAPVEEASGSSKQASVADEPASAPKPQTYPDTSAMASSSTTFGRSSPFASGSGMSGGKASIPAWQMAMSKSAGNSTPGSSTAAATNGTEATASEGQ